ncbi:MFS transporter [Methylobacterium pseudosasicola]|uniref:Nitrate/nitrite transporter NarK n=1 Tax=Methylobacterium pseudosasicola TaxID=582667 RepID=A0A1I4NK01_9HYPH|nr:MFS transporter [Methylobacterium pseudosasicola]SFM15637.1 Nitrate/nitrite transporter NarK [Methylobacterium pseudosasicola]
MSTSTEVAASAMRKITIRFVPLLFICFIVSFLDRVNVGFAALTMNKDLGFSASIFGFGAGLFFLTYVLFEVPSNLMLERYGARVWIARIMITWGLVSALTAFVAGPLSFYAIRLLLGAAEAGFFPGVIFLLLHWIPPSFRGRVVGTFMAAMPVASALGSPVSGLLLNMDGILGLHGWQWLFLIEAVPAVLLAPVVLYVLSDKPADAAWLTDAEKAWVQQQVSSGLGAGVGHGHSSLRAVFTDPRVLLLALAWFGLTGINYGLSFFLPQIVAAFGLSLVATGLLSAVPFALAGVAMVVWGKRSDRMRERRNHIYLPALLAVAGLIGTAYSSLLVTKLAFLCIAAIGVFSALPLFWSLPPMVLSPATAAAGIALVNALGNLSGFVQPNIMGFLKDRFGGFEGGLLSIALFALIAVVCIWSIATRLGVGAVEADPALARAGVEHS